MAGRALGSGAGECAGAGAGGALGGGTSRYMPRGRGAGPESAVGPGPGARAAVVVAAGAPAGVWAVAAWGSGVVRAMREASDTGTLFRGSGPANAVGGPGRGTGTGQTWGNEKGVGPGGKGGG